MDKIKIYVRNNGKTVEVPLGSNLEEVYKLSGLQMEHGPVSAHVNNKVEGMHYRAYKQKGWSFSTSLHPAVPELTPEVCSSCFAKPPMTSSPHARWPSTSL